jgi:hypothetical protein
MQRWIPALRGRARGRRAAGRVFIIGFPLRTAPMQPYDSSVLCFYAAMDTSSPWEGEGAGEGAEGGWADFSTASQEETHGGDGWADFGAMSEAAPEVAAAPVAGSDVAGFEADFSSLADESGVNNSGNTDSGTGESGTQGSLLFTVCRPQNPQM